MLDAPPKKQIIQNGQIAWGTSPVDTSSLADEVLLYARRVRNNLFHGGKFNGRWFEPERSEGLLRATLTILKACVEHHPDVRQAYHE